LPAAAHPGRVRPGALPFRPDRSPRRPARP